MKKYQSHKVVEAAPIVAAEFLEDGSGQVWIKDPDGPGSKLVVVPPGFKRPNTDPSMDPDGGDYLVRYQPDGYLSWSPKAVFEAGYTLAEYNAVSEDWKTRLKAEYVQLCERLEKLRDYMRSNYPLPDDQIKLLRAQERAMGLYFQALAYRLEHAGLMKIDGPRPGELTQPGPVEVTVTAPAGKRAHVSLGSMGHSARSSWTVTGGQRQTWSVAPGEFVTVHEDQPHSTVAEIPDSV